MNMKIRKSLKIALMATIIGAMSLPIFAKPTLQKIEAFLNPTLTYILDGKEVLEDVDAITYKDTTYISLAELSKALGKEISYDNGTITMTTPTAEAKETKETAAPTVPEYMTIEKAIIKEVDLANGKVTILPDGKEDKMENYIILNVDPATLGVSHEFLRIALTADALVPGYEVSVKHSPIMTASLPPQTTAFEIVILGGQEFPIVTPALPESMTIENATIKAVNVESGQVTILPAGLEDNHFNYIVLNVGEKETSIHHEINRRAYRINDLEVGMKVTAKHSPIMTMSIPPQTPALEIIILVDQDTK